MSGSGPNGSASAVAVFTPARVAVAAEAAKKARLFMFPPIGWPFSYRVLPVLTRARLAPRVHRGEAMPTVTRISAPANWPLLRRAFCCDLGGAINARLRMLLVDARWFDARQPLGPSIEIAS